MDSAGRGTADHVSHVIGSHNIRRFSGTGYGSFEELIPHAAQSFSMRSRRFDDVAATWLPRTTNEAGLTRKRLNAMAGQKIRIRLKSYDHEVIDTSARKIVDTVTRAGATVVGPVPLPTEKNVYAVIRSPHKYKDSREHFEMRTHKRLIDIVDPTPKAVDSLMRLDLPADVNIEIKL